MKKLMNWSRVKVSGHKYIDVNTDNTFNNITNWASFQETPYQIDWKFIWIIDMPEDTSQERIDELITAYSDFKFKFITEAEANEQLTNLWTDDNNEPYISVKDFIFTDNTPDIE